MTTLQLVGLAAATGITLWVVSVLRRRHLREKYVVLWILVAAVQVVLAVWPGVLDTVAGWLGVADPPNLLAVGAVVFLLLVCAHLSWEASRLEEETRTLAEEIAMLRADLDRLSPPDDGPGLTDPPLAP